MKQYLLAMLCGLAVGCSGVGDSADPKKIIPVEDHSAIDSTPPHEDKVAKLSIMDSLPQGGLCSVQNYRRNADALREIRYETSNPRRSYIIEIGKPPRAYPPLSIEISGAQESPGLRETENVYIAFNASGSVSVGVRRYMATGSETANDRGPLLYTDSALAVAYANRIIDTCR